MYYCLTEYNTIRTLDHRPYYNKKENYYFDIEYDYNTGKLIDIKLKIFSENVFDLIEIGDLIKEDDDSIYEVDEIDEEEDNEEETQRVFISQPADFIHYEREIIAIYKKDNKGNYIKVWRREDEMEYS